MAETSTGGLISGTLVCVQSRRPHGLMAASIPTASILSVPGSSACFVGGIAAYGLEARTKYLGWTEEKTKAYEYVKTLLLHQSFAHTRFGLHSGPTEDIVLDLASHLNESLKTTYSLAESGATGPTLPNKYRAEIDQIGFCPLGLVSNDGLRKSETVRVNNQPRERGDNMVQFVKEALEMLLAVLKEREAEAEGKDGRL